METKNDTNIQYIFEKNGICIISTYNGKYNTTMHNVVNNKTQESIVDLPPQQYTVNVTYHKDLIFERLRKDFNLSKEETIEFCNEMVQDFKTKEKLKFETKEVISNKVIKSAEKVLSEKPMEYLKSIVAKYHFGDQDLIELYILSLMSMNEQVGFLENIWVLGNSDGGKSTSQFKTAESIVPKEYRFHVDKQSPKYIYYAAKEYSLKKKLIILDDVTEDDMEILKTHCDNTKPKSRGIVIDGKGEVQKPDGIPLWWISKVSTLEDEGNQVMRRFLLANVESSNEHKDIVANTIQKNRSNKINTKVVPDEVAQQILRICIEHPGQVIVPIKYELPDKRPSLIHFFHTLIECNALLNYKKRDIITRVIDNGDLIEKNVVIDIIASQEDIDVAKRLWSMVKTMNEEKISGKEADVLSILLPKMIGIANPSLCSREFLSIKTGINENTLKGIIAKLKERGIIENMQLKPKDNKSWITIKISDNNVPDWFKGIKLCGECHKPIETGSILNFCKECIDKKNKTPEPKKEETKEQKTESGFKTPDIRDL